MKITVLGCGRWATFLGWYANHIDHEVLIWGRESSRNLNQLKETRKNDYSTLDDKDILDHSLSEAIEHTDSVLI